jgi:hypothetical protein
MTDEEKYERKNEIELDEIHYVPLLLVKDPDYCFRGITTESELDFICSLRTEEWENLGHIWMDFDVFTEEFKELIFETYSNEYEQYKSHRVMKIRDNKIEEVLREK